MPDGSKKTVVRRRYAITGGYTFTDIKAQGQTIEVVIIDLRNTPSGRISPFSAYVALSRSRGRDTIRLLSDFDENLFKSHPNEDLAIEMERLGLLGVKTLRKLGLCTM
jgi:ATP-dependent exoDNAse (exonuclease V) alpha subunit